MEENRKTSQRERLRLRLIAGERITSVQGQKEEGIKDMATRVFELKALGYDIKTVMVPYNGTFGLTRIAEYYIDIPNIIYNVNVPKGQNTSLKF